MSPIAKHFEFKNIKFNLLPKKQGFEVHHEWLERFAQKLKTPSGKFKIGQYAWQSFEVADIKSVNGDEGEKLYLSMKIEDYFVIFENGKEVYDCQASAWVEFDGMEVIVFPKGKLWTMMYSHENTKHYIESET